MDNRVAKLYTFGRQAIIVKIMMSSLSAVFVTVKDLLFPSASVVLFFEVSTGLCMGVCVVMSDLKWWLLWNSFVIHGRRYPFYMLLGCK